VFEDHVGDDDVDAVGPKWKFAAVALHERTFARSLWRVEMEVHTNRFDVQRSAEFRGYLAVLGADIE
jgi:hypothetical protein